MPNKQLTAKVKLNTTQAEKSLERLTKKIDAVNKAINKQSGAGSLDKQIKKAVTQQEKLTRATNKTSNATNKVKQGWAKVDAGIRKVISNNPRLTSAYDSISNKLRQIPIKVGEWKNKQDKVNASARSTNSILGSIWSKLKGIASTYLGILGTKAAISTSDALTSAQNRLNYSSAKQLNGAGFNSDGTYSDATLAMSQEAFDQAYASSQKVRMGYTDMLSNVSKSVVLAGDAFDYSIDNAIRFQEIMAEAYAVGGASAEEMSSSMYQMIQALGSGTLAGDELRSVREGAPLAYKAIEDFVQGIYQTEDSLKDLAAEGKVSADMVVAAILNAGDELDSAFAQTKQTFAQTWTQIKNAAIRAFLPVSNMLNDLLQKALDNGLIEKIESIFLAIAKFVMTVINLLVKVFTWIADNWYWIKYVILGVLIVIMGHMLMSAAVAVASAAVKIASYIQEYWWLLLIAATITMLIYTFVQWRDGAISTCDAIVLALGTVAMALIIVGLVTGNMYVLVAGIILGILVIAFYFFEEICAALSVTWAFIVNVILSCANFYYACLNWCSAVFGNFIAWICNVFSGATSWLSALWYNCVSGVVNVTTAMGNVINAVASNIKIAFQNAWSGAKAAFWNFIADCLEGLMELIGPLNSILEALDKTPISISGLSASARSRANSYAEKGYIDISAAWSMGLNSREYQDLGEAWSTGYNSNAYKSASNAWSAGMNTYDTWQNGWAQNAWDSGYSWGEGIKDRINAWGSQFQNSNGGRSFWDSLEEWLGIDLDDYFNGSEAFPSGSGYTAGDGYVPPSNDDLLNGINGDVGDISDNTASMADTLELSEDDLSYLRDVANMEWKKEFTTANITVDMSNYNTINGDGDLDGIVTRLTGKLYEELGYLADGVYA